MESLCLILRKALMNYGSEVYIIYVRDGAQL